MYIYIWFPYSHYWIPINPNIQYILGLLQFCRDFLLDELQVHLHEFCDLDVSISTIWQALQNARLTWKKVLVLLTILALSLIFKLLSWPKLWLSEVKSNRPVSSMRLDNTNLNNWSLLMKAPLISTWLTVSMADHSMESVLQNEVTSSVVDGMNHSLAHIYYLTCVL